jgi:sterol desaturase/sphingolipid hydroxylase (fatty acid hydroxylase superfamily)
MPNVIDILLDPVSLTVFALYAALIGWEALAPARVLPHVPGWKWLGLTSFAVYFLLSSYLPLLWSEQLAAWQVFDLTALGTWGGAIAGLLVYELGAYWWHRSMHRSNVLWRIFHQMHHSAERVDTFGTFWFSPLDMIGWTALSSLCLTAIVGLTPGAVTLVLVTTTFLAAFQHANISTPRWLGYFVQRPESHSHHHGRNVHADNYADLPVFDVLFGTFRNPERFAAENGFYDGASARVVEMICWRDVATPREQVGATVIAEASRRPA